MNYSKTEFTFPSVSGLAAIHAAKYIPQGEVKAVFQIAHGMAEHFGTPPPWPPPKRRSSAARV